MPSILFLAHRVPYPPNRGDRIRSYNLIRFLAHRAEVDLAFLSEQPVECDTERVLTGICRRVAWSHIDSRGRWINAALSLARGKTATEGLFCSRKLDRTIRDWSSETQYDAVVIFCSSMVQYLSSIRNVGKNGLDATKVLVDLVDVDSQKWFDYGQKTFGLKRFLFELEGRRLRKFEGSLLHHVDAITLVSQSEADLFRETLTPANDRLAGKIHAIPNGVDLEYFSPLTPNPSHLSPFPPLSPLTCLFLGALDYRANIDGLEWFCEYVWPDLHRRCPEARFEIVGSNPSSTVHRLVRVPGVELIGPVPDVRPHLSRATVVVAPLRVARGIQNKVLEALAMGKSVVASSQALEGLNVQPGVHALRADTPQDWVEAITNLFGDASKRVLLGEAGRAFVEHHHSWEACLAPFDVLLRSIGVSRTVSLAGAACCL